MRHPLPVERRWHDAVLKGNDTQYGLAAAVWTRDVSRAHRVARALKSGRVWINTYAETDPVMSMGGYKQSGFGREMGAESIEAYTQTKSVFMRIDEVEPLAVVTDGTEGIE